MTTIGASAPRHRSVFFLVFLLVFAFVTPTVPHGRAAAPSEDRVAVFATHPLPASLAGQPIPLADVPAEAAAVDLPDAGFVPFEAEPGVLSRAVVRSTARAPPR